MLMVMFRLFAIFTVVGGYLAWMTAQSARAEVAESCQADIAQRAFSLDPVGLYGTDKLRFDIYRNGSKVGRHDVRFRDDGDVIFVESETSIVVTLLRVPVYRYEYASIEQWCRGRIVSVETQVIENGKETRVAAELEAEGFAVTQGDSIARISAKDILTTNHWNARVLDADQVFNTITGRLNRVEIAPSSEAASPADSQNRNITTYRYRGDLNIAVSYDREGRWAGLAFQDKKGAPIEFRCVQCGVRLQQFSELRGSP